MWDESWLVTGMFTILKMWEDVNEGEKGSKVMGMALAKEKYSGWVILHIQDSREEWRKEN